MSGVFATHNFLRVSTYYDLDDVFHFSTSWPVAVWTVNLF